MCKYADVQIIKFGNLIIQKMKGLKSANTHI